MIDDVATAKKKKDATEEEQDKSVATPGAVNRGTGAARTQGEYLQSQQAAAADEATAQAIATGKFMPKSAGDLQAPKGVGAPKREDFPEGLGGLAEFNQAIRKYNAAHGGDSMGATPPSKKPDAGTQADELAAGSADKPKKKVQSYGNQP